MALKIRLSNNKFGQLLIEKNDPVGINDIAKSIKRSAEYEGIMFEVILDLEFIKESRRFLSQCHYFDGGIDALVIVDIYEYDPNTYTWELYFHGQVNFNNWDFGETDVVVTVEQAGIDRRVLNSMEIDVDAETEESENGAALPEQMTFDSEWHSKSVLKEFFSRPENSVEHQQLGAFRFTFPPVGDVTEITTGNIMIGQLDNSDFESSELEDVFSTPFGFLGHPDPDVWVDIGGGAGSVDDYISFLTSNGIYKQNRNPFYVAVEQGLTDIIATIKIKSRILADNDTGGDVDLVDGTGGVLGHCEVYLWFEHRNADDDVLLVESMGVLDMSTGQTPDWETHQFNKVGLDVQVGDKLYFFCTYRVYGTYEPPGLLDPGGSGIVNHDFYIQLDKNATEFQVLSSTIGPPTTVRSVMIYEAFERCLQFFTNQPVCFYSELLGRIDRGYAQDGEASLIAINNGHWIRGKYDWRNNDEHKKLFLNLKTLIEFVNQYQCVGFGFETVDMDGKLVGTGDTGLPYGTKVFRLEKRQHFYRKEKVLSLGKVYNVRKKLVNKLYWNLFEYGYTGKLDTKLRNAVDEFNTLRKNRIPVINTKNQLKVATGVKTSGYQIELQRRLATSKEDSNHDDEIFATSMIRSGDTFVPKKMEGYAEINNVLEPQTGYNYDFAPARCRLNWLPFIAPCLIRRVGDKTLYFSSGQTNYRVSTRKDGELAVVAEDANVSLDGVEPIYDPEVYVLENVRFTRDQMRLLQQNPYGYIEFEDQFGEFMYGFVDSGNGVEQNPDKRQASLNLLKVHNPV